MLFHKNMTPKPFRVSVLRSLTSGVYDFAKPPKRLMANPLWCSLATQTQLFPAKMRNDDLT